MVFGYVVKHASPARRRNAIIPDDVEHLVSNLPGHTFKLKRQKPRRPSLERHRVGLYYDSSTELDQSSSSYAELDPQGDMKPVALLRPTSQQTIAFNGDVSGLSDFQSNSPTQARPEKKRKYAAISEEDDYYDPQPAPFDVVHPSEMKFKAEDVEAEKIEDTHDEFPMQAAIPDSPTQHAARATNRALLISYAIGLMGPWHDNTAPTRPGRPINFDEAGTILTTCPDGSYCCGRDNEECCRRNAGYQINPRNGQILIRSETSTSSSTTSSSRISTTSTSSPTSTPAAAGASQTSSTDPSALPTPLPSSSTGLSAGAKAGIAIGAIAGVTIIGALAFLLFRERKKRRALAANEKQTSMGYGYGNNNMAEGRHEMQQPPSELGAYERNNEQKYQFRGELGDGQGRPSELHS
ncbi:MAG: hypothetical protein Q9172_003729 [Xanthocarpia lactea]